MINISYTTCASVCLAGLMEGFGIPWPGAFLIAGAAISLGDQFAGVSIATALFTLGYTVGSLLQYLVGRLIGPAAVSWLPTTQRSRLNGLMLKHGPAAVLWLRPLSIGNYVSLPAGMTRMPLARFTLYTMLGVAPWACSMGLAGWFLGDQVHVVSAAIAQWLVPGAVILGTVAALVRGVRLWCHRGDSDGAVCDSGR